MTPNDQEVASQVAASVEIADDPLSSNDASDGEDDDRIKVQENPLDDSNDYDDMKSLLPTATESESTPAPTKSKMTSLDVHHGDDDDEYDDDDDLRNNTLLESENYCFGLIKGARIGNMRILFPEYYYTSGWGVVGPNLIGPVVVWLILATATHGVLNGIEKHNLGFVSVVIAYVFFAVSTYRLTDVCYRTPGIVLDQEIPGHEPPERAREYRYCDRCKVWQPPDGVHCPECNVCVAGYDHYCVWMGTTIGRGNYKQFVKFNMTVSGIFWFLYLGYLFVFQALS